MSGALSLFLTAGLFGSPLEGGTWLPTVGPAGDQAVLAMAAGGDGALYAAGRGWVYRMEPGQAWQPVGWYVPQLTWDQDQGFEAVGPFPAEFLARVVDDLTAALETQLSLEPDQGNITEDLVRDLVESYAVEPDPRPESPYAVARMAPSRDGVWLGTGGGLFRVSANGVAGPVARLWPIHDLLATDEAVYAAAPGGLYRVTDGGVELWRQFEAASLARVDGRAAFLAEEGVWWDDGQVGPRRLKTPTGSPRVVASGGDVLWVATDLAIYRWAGDDWTLCPRIPETPHRLTSTGEVLVAIADQTIYVTDRTCSKWLELNAPWLGGLRFTDVAFSPAGLWGATTEGVFFLGPNDPELSVTTTVEGLRRKIDRFLTLDETLKASLKASNLDPQSAGYGYRPALRLLLPEVKLRVSTRPSRKDRQPTFLGGAPQLETRPPRASIEILAVWRINFDFLTLLIDSQASADALGAQSDDPLLSPEFAAERSGFGQLPAEDLQQDIGQEALVAVNLAEEPEPGVTAVDEAALSLLVAERNQLRRDRGKLYKDLRRLYKERLRLTYRLHVTRAERVDATDLLKLTELDARLDAYTGGAWTRALNRTPSGGQ